MSEADSPSGTPALSRSRTSRALGAFVQSSGLWGAWGQMIGIGTAVLTGYALWLGASEAEIAYFVSIASVASIAQTVSSGVAARVRRKRAFMLGLGVLEFGFRFGIVLIPLLFHHDYRVLAMGLLIGLSLTAGHIVSPIYNAWMSTIIPEDIRARFFGRQTTANLLAGMAAALAAGWYVDRFTEAGRYEGFLTVFAVATGVGYLGYLNLLRIPYVEPDLQERTGNLLTPFREPGFRNLAIFFLVWNSALGIGGPFYSVFMLKDLGISYTIVAVLNGAFLASMILGYRLWPVLIDRYGGKVVLQILVPPTMLTPVLWSLNRPDAYALVPVAMVLNGLLYSGVLAAVTPLLYGVLPARGDRTTYFASWSISINLAYAGAPLLGSFLVDGLAGVRFNWLGYPIGNLQIVFLVSGIVLVLPVFLLRRVTDPKTTTPMQLISTVGKGNLLSYVYSAYVFDSSGAESRRARAARWLGRSRSPMALDTLIRALDDPSPEVRRQAVTGLGHARSPAAVVHLVDELRDPESDVRSEAAEALGRIGEAGVLDPLIDALGDSDSRVRISAIRALAEIGNPEAAEILFWKLAEGFDRDTFPTLADVLGRAGDVRITSAVFANLDRYRSSAIRLQLLNSICRAVGDTRRFYQLISLDSLERAQRIVRELGAASRSIRRARALPGRARTILRRDLDRILQAYEEGSVEAFRENIPRLLQRLEDEVDAPAVALLGPDAAARLGAAVLAIRRVQDHPDLDPEVATSFVVVCIACSARALEQRR